jgi:hypothetical protein
MKGARLDQTMKLHLNKNLSFLTENFDVSTSTQLLKLMQLLPLKAED